MDLKELQVVEVKGIRTLTSKQLAECYGTTTDIIKKNFSRNRERYVEGKHYICFSGDELKEFKHEVTKSHPVNKQVTISALVGNRASHLYLWTEKGTLLHAKSLNTDKAWEVYDYLVDFYFRAKEVIPVQEQPKPEPVKESSGKLFVDVPENPEIQKRMSVTRDYLTALDVALREYDMYHEEDRYKNYRVMVDNLSITLLSKVHDLLEIKPNFVRKHY